MDVILSSFFSGIIQVIIGHPFDTIKTINQNNNFLNKNIKLKNFYRGIKYPIIQTPLINVSNFYYNDYFIKKYNMNLFNSSILSGFISSIIITPLDYCKINNQQNLKKNINFIKILCSYKHYHIVSLREVPALFIYFNSYDYSKKYIHSYSLCGSLAGVLSWLLTYPIDTIKTRLQSNSANSIKDAILQKNLFNGIKPCLYRAFIVNGVGFYVYEKGLLLFKRI